MIAVLGASKRRPEPTFSSYTCYRSVIKFLFTVTPNASFTLRPVNTSTLEDGTVKVTALDSTRPRQTTFVCKSGIGFMSNVPGRIDHLSATDLTDPLEVGRHGSTSDIRWVIRRKLDVVAAINDGTLDRSEFSRIYSICGEELASWEAAYNRAHQANSCRCSVPNYACYQCAGITPPQSKRARKALGWTMADAAQVTGVSIRSLTRFETNKRLSTKTMQKLRHGYESKGIKFERNDNSAC